MGNSFNISVKPEIAAAVAKIDDIDAVVDLIRGTDVVNIQANIDDNETKIDDIDAIVDLIRGTDVVNIQSNIDDNETKIDTIDSIVDDIKLKTDLIPQNVRGKLTRAALFHDAAEYADVVNVTGKGKLWLIYVKSAEATGSTTILVTIDGLASQELVTPAATDQYMITPYIDVGSLTISIFYTKPPDFVTLSNLSPCIWDVEFDTSLRVQTLKNAGDGNINCLLYYFLDDF